MKPKSFEIAIKFDAEQQIIQITLGENTSKIGAGLQTVKDILGFLQVVIIKNFC